MRYEYFKYKKSKNGASTKGPFSEKEHPNFIYPNLPKRMIQHTKSYITLLYNALILQFIYLFYDKFIEMFALKTKYYDMSFFDNWP